MVVSSGSILFDSRNNILKNLLKSVFVIVFICFLIDTNSIIKNGWRWTFAFNYFLILALILLVHKKSISLTVKSYSFSIICLLFSAYFYITYGSLPAPVLILLVSGMTASVLLGMKRGFIILIINFIALLFVLFNYRFGWVEAGLMIDQEPSIISFITITVTFLVASVASIYVPGYLKNCLHHEISERAKAEQEARQYAEQQVNQIKEIHHRVKNNMQIISSMLNLQSYKTKNTEVKRIMENSRDRINSMSLLHESIYKSTVTEKIDVERYLKSITQSLQSAHYSEVSRFQLHHNISDVSLKMETCIPLGLIVNELVNNAMKYAFKKTGKGDIWIEFFENGDNKIKLIVRDNGVGLPKKVHSSNNGSMGLFLTDIFVKQLQGKLTVDGEEGARFEIEFDKPE